MRIFACLLLLAGASPAQRQEIQRWELRPAADGLRLYVTILGEDRLISNRATGAWEGWAPQFLLYAERETSESSRQRLRWYESFTRNSYTISTGEEMEYVNVVPVRLSGGEYAFLISLRDRASRIPYVELGTRQGVFLRESHAAFGVAANDLAQILRYSPSEVEAQRGDLSLLSPVATSSVPLKPATPDATGIYESTLPAADGLGRTVTLNLRPGGQAALVTAFEGRSDPVAQRGTWKQAGAEVRFESERGRLVWVLGANGLTPKSWSRDQWGAQGLILRRTLTAVPAGGAPPPRAR